MRITVHVKPGARTSRVGGMAAGSLLVRVRPTQPTGLANEATVEAVARSFGLVSHQVHVVIGRNSQRKVLELAIDDAKGAVRLAELKGAAVGRNPPHS